MLPGSKEEKLWQMEMALRRRQPAGKAARIAAGRLG